MLHIQRKSYILRRQKRRCSELRRTMRRCTEIPDLSVAGFAFSLSARHAEAHWSGCGCCCVWYSLGLERFAFASAVCLRIASNLHVRTSHAYNVLNADETCLRTSTCKDFATLQLNMYTRIESNDACIRNSRQEREHQIVHVIVYGCGVCCIHSTHIFRGKSSSRNTHTHKTHPNPTHRHITDNFVYAFLVQRFWSTTSKQRKCTDSQSETSATRISNIIASYERTVSTPQCFVATLTRFWRLSVSDTCTKCCTRNLCGRPCPMRFGAVVHVLGSDLLPMRIVLLGPGERTNMMLATDRDACDMCVVHPML